MVGYNHKKGMSNNAVTAQQDGRMPLSKITISMLRKAGWEETKKIANALAKNGTWEPCEWHHCSGWYNEVSFYDPYDLVDIWDRMSDQEKERIRNPPKQNPDSDACTVKGKYPIWGGTKKRPQIEDWKYFKGSLKGDWITIDGGKRKKASGKYIEWEEVKG